MQMPANFLNYEKALRLAELSCDHDLDGAVTFLLRDLNRVLLGFLLKMDQFFSELSQKYLRLAHKTDKNALKSRL